VEVELVSEAEVVAVVVVVMLLPDCE